MDLGELKNSIADAYSVDSLGQLLVLAMKGDRLEKITTARGFDQQVFDVIEFYSKEGRLAEFILQASRENPDNRKLRSFLIDLIDGVARPEDSPNIGGEGEEVADLKLAIELQRVSDKIFGLPGNGGGMSGDVRRLQEKISPLEIQISKIGAIAERGEQASKRNSVALAAIDEKVTGFSVELKKALDRVGISTTIVNPPAPAPAAVVTEPRIEITQRMLWAVIGLVFIFLPSLFAIVYFLSTGGGQ